MYYSKRSVVSLLAFGCVLLVIVLNAEFNKAEEHSLKNHETGLERSSRLTRAAKKEEADAEVEKGGRPKKPKKPKKPTKKPSKPDKPDIPEPDPNNNDPENEGYEKAKKKDKKKEKNDKKDDETDDKKDDKTEDSDEDELEQIKKDQLEESKLIKRIIRAIKEWDGWLHAHDNRTLNKFKSLMLMRTFNKVAAKAVKAPTKVPQVVVGRK